MKTKERPWKIICLGLFFIAIMFLITSGCASKDLTKGTIAFTEYEETDAKGTFTYEETDEITNYIKIVTNDSKVIIVELYPDIAPLTVANFQKLVSEKFYDGLIFHRVISDFMIQTGDPKGTGMGGSKDTIKGEFGSNGVKNNLKHKKGILSMARTKEYNSASSQFFICSAANEGVSNLDGDYAAFGRVIAGFETVLEISKTKTDSNDKPITPKKMQTVRFVKIENVD